MVFLILLLLIFIHNVISIPIDGFQADLLRSEMTLLIRWIPPVINCTFSNWELTYYLNNNVWHYSTMSRVTIIAEFTSGGFSDHSFFGISSSPNPDTYGYVTLKEYCEEQYDPISTWKIDLPIENVALSRIAKFVHRTANTVTFGWNTTSPFKEKDCEFSRWLIGVCTQDKKNCDYSISLDPDLRQFTYKKDNLTALGKIVFTAQLQCKYVEWMDTKTSCWYDLSQGAATYVDPSLIKDLAAVNNDSPNTVDLHWKIQLNDCLNPFFKIYKGSSDVELPIFVVSPDFQSARVFELEIGSYTFSMMYTCNGFTSSRTAVTNSIDIKSARLSAPNDYDGAKMNFAYQYNFLALDFIPKVSSGESGCLHHHTDVGYCIASQSGCSFPSISPNVMKIACAGIDYVEGQTQDCYVTDLPHGELLFSLRESCIDSDDANSIWSTPISYFIPKDPEMDPITAIPTSPYSATLFFDRFYFADCKPTMSDDSWFDIPKLPEYLVKYSVYSLSSGYEFSGELFSSDCGPSYNNGECLYLNIVGLEPHSTYNGTIYLDCYKSPFLLSKKMPFNFTTLSPPPIPPPSPSEPSSHTGVLVGCICAGVFVFVGIALFIWFRKRRAKPQISLESLLATEETSI